MTGAALDRTRLARVLSMLGSSHDGEARYALTQERTAPLTSMSADPWVQSDLALNHQFRRWWTEVPRPPSERKPPNGGGTSGRRDTEISVRRSPPKRRRQPTVGHTSRARPPPEDARHSLAGERWDAGLRCRLHHTEYRPKNLTARRNVNAQRATEQLRVARCGSSVDGVAQFNPRAPLSTRAGRAR
jgi:hypothetical protein